MLKGLFLVYPKGVGCEVKCACLSFFSSLLLLFFFVGLVPTVLSHLSVWLPNPVVLPYLFSVSKYWQILEGAYDFLITFWVCLWFSLSITSRAEKVSDFFCLCGRLFYRSRAWEKLQSREGPILSAPVGPLGPLERSVSHIEMILFWDSSAKSMSDPPSILFPVYKHATILLLLRTFESRRFWSVGRF